MLENFVQPKAHLRWVRAELLSSEDEDEDMDVQDLEMGANGVIDLTGARLGKRKRDTTDV